MNFFDPAASHDDAQRTIDAENELIDAPNIEAAGQQIEAMGNDLAAAASGHMRDIDMDDARSRLRDVQSALAGLGYSLADGEGDHETSIDQGGSRALDACVRQFQDDFGLEVSGRIDRDTYEALLRAAEEAMEVQDRGPTDDAGLVGDPVAAPGQLGDEGLGLQSADALDGDEQALLNLQDDLDAGLDIQELEDL